MQSTGVWLLNRAKVVIAAVHILFERHMDSMDNKDHFRHSKEDTQALSNSSIKPQHRLAQVVGSTRSPFTTRALRFLGARRSFRCGLRFRARRVPCRVFCFERRAVRAASDDVCVGVRGERRRECCATTLVTFRLGLLS